MEELNFRSDHQSHVAQQSRREKLRVHHHQQQQHLEELPNNLERFSVIPGLNSDQLMHLRNVRCPNLLYEPTVFSSDMINFSTNSSNVLSSSAAHRVGMVRPMLGAAQVNKSGVVDDCSLDQAISSSNFNESSKANADPPGCSNWSLGAQRSSCGWMDNCASGSVGSEQTNQNHHLFGGEPLSNTATIMNNISGSTQYIKSYNGYHQDMQSSLNTPSSELSSDQDIRKQCGSGMHFTSPVFQNTLQEVVTSASTGTRRGSWTASGNELALLPAYGNQSFDDNAVGWSHRSVQNCHQHCGELGFIAKKSGTEELSNIFRDRNTEGLSLTLSSNPPSQLQVLQFGEGYQSEDLPSRVSDLPKDPQDFNDLNNSVISRGSCGKNVKDIAGTSTFSHPGTGPLGPFTGYATILKSSKFLRPAQQLLDEFCGVRGSKLIKTSEVPERISGKASISAASSSTLYSSNEMSAGECGVGGSSSESCQPEYQQKKAKLIYMHEEVCRRYKQYHQQMQMVVSSFESVAGLSEATPYISLALKTVSRHFRCLRNAISDQLIHIRKALGEDLSSPTTGTSSTKGDTNMLRLKYMEQNIQKHKSAGDNVGFNEPQHVWRPQRGLPERSVAILKTWLFEHFLHPYPTDTDKHMLATQTGLSRNQVSNWFINARVRVWKPMVEEIHMLETKGLAETHKNEENSVGEGTGCSNVEETTNKFGIINALSTKRLEFPSIGSSDIGMTSEQWNQEKRSRVECQLPSSVDGSFMGFVPYQRGGLEMGGLGAVSLTLGLRRSAENAQQQQQFQQQEDQLQRQFGGHIFHDFVG